MKQYELSVGLRQEGDHSGSYQSVLKALQLNPDNAYAHLLLGNLYLLDRDERGPGHDADAEQHFLKVLELEAARDDSDAVRPRKHNLKNDAINGLGVLYIHLGRYDEAIGRLKGAAEDIRNPEAYMAWGNLGWAYTQQKRYDEAVEALQRSVRLQGRFCVGYFRLGKVLVYQEKFEDADGALTAALEAHPSCDQLQGAWHLRGQARMHLGDREHARSDFERCIELAEHTEDGKACRRYLEATY